MTSILWSLLEMCTADLDTLLCPVPGSLGLGQPLLGCSCASLQVVHSLAQTFNLLLCLQAHTASLACAAGSSKSAATGKQQQVWQFGSPRGSVAMRSQLGPASAWQTVLQLLLLQPAPDGILPVLQLHQAENVLHKQTDVNLLSSLLLPGRGLLHLLLPPTLQLREVLALVSLVAKSPRVSALQVAQLLLAVCQALLQSFDLPSPVSQVGLHLISPHVQRASVLHSTRCPCRYEKSCGESGPDICR